MIFSETDMPAYMNFEGVGEELQGGSISLVGAGMLGSALLTWRGVPGARLCDYSKNCGGRGGWLRLGAPGQADTE